MFAYNRFTQKKCEGVVTFRAGDAGQYRFDLFDLEDKIETFNAKLSLKYSSTT